MTDLVNLLTYLNDKKVPYMLPLDENLKPIVKYPELNITKKGKFYYANGVLVAKNMINNYIN